MPDGPIVLSHIVTKPAAGLGQGARLLKTGQTTVYVAGDDGTNQLGVAKSYTVLNTGQYAGNTNITINSKTDVHTNACVQDNNTRLMWSRTLAASVGPASDGKLPWTTTGSGGTAEGIWPYVAAANAASLAGYTDWRIPNINELDSIQGHEIWRPDTTAFSIAAGAIIWSSTTSQTAANALTNNGNRESETVKTGTNTVLLVRGGNP